MILLGFTTTALARENMQFYKDEIKEVVETFKTLFHSDKIPWTMVFSVEMVKRKRKDNPNFPRTFGGVGSPLKTMSDEKSNDREEKIWNIKIDTDGYLASVYFNYSDHLNGHKRASGTESWDLVREDSGWKIISVSYMVTQNTTP